jgi:poly-gamma-glutamate synthesis protein (capsule biosynthesis protein)
MKIFKLASLTVFLVIFGLGAGIGIGFLENFFNSDSFSNLTASVPSMANVELPKEEPPEINLIFVGDIMLDRGVRRKIETVGGGDFRFPFLKIANLLKEADIVVGNLEGPLSDKGKEIGNPYSFRMPLQALDGFTFVGFDVLFLANNHIGDWGEEALEDTVLNLRNVGILPVGAGVDLEEAYLPKTVEIKGVKFAFLAFSDFFVPGVALAKKEKIKSAVNETKALADLVVVAFHFGDEYSKEPSERQKLLAQLAIDNGADLVVGSHPHVLQPLETYNGKYIAYSLGNFVFDQNFSKETMTGGLLRVVLGDKSIVSVGLNELQINEHFQPMVE